MPTNTQRQIIWNKLGYKPTASQMAVHESTKRIRLVAGGERAGKSKLAAMELMSRFHEGKLFWLVAADYERTQAEFDYIVDSFVKMGLTLNHDIMASKHVDPGEIDVMGEFKIITKSAKDPRRLGMHAPDGVLVCEASQIDYETFLRVRGRIAEKRGWLLMTGTFESSLGWYPEAFLRWQMPNEEDALSFSLPTWSNTVVYPGGENDPEILALKKSGSKEWFAERYGGVPCPPTGLVLPDFRNTIHTGSGGTFEFNPTEKVWLWIDPGYRHFYAVEVVQRRGEDVFVVDEIYEKGLVTSDIITICKKQPWWNKVAGGVTDIAARAHAAMPAVVEVWQSEAGLTLSSKKVGILEGIERFKTSLKVNPVTGRPGFYINTKCHGLISELGGCANPLTGMAAPYIWKISREGTVVGEEPQDSNNDAVKACIYGLVDMLGYTPTHRSEKIGSKFF